MARSTLPIRESIAPASGQEGGLHCQSGGRWMLCLPSLSLRCIRFWTGVDPFRRSPFWVGFGSLKCNSIFSQCPVGREIDRGHWLHSSGERSEIGEK